MPLHSRTNRFGMPSGPGALSCERGIKAATRSLSAITCDLWSSGGYAWPVISLRLAGGGGGETCSAALIHHRGLPTGNVAYVVSLMASCNTLIFSSTWSFASTSRDEC